jgi:ornithine cyclodeaminase/alanine dehydrogenase-like protein (mu-crystallin family)
MTKNQPTIYKSVGLSLEVLALAEHIYKRITENNHDNSILTIKNYFQNAKDKHAQ